MGKDKIIKNKSNQKKDSKTFKINVRCSPEKRENDYTCYSDDSLLKLRNFWNARHPDRRINTEEPREIWNELKNKMSNVCESESCWLRQKFIKENVDKELLNFTFAPKSPESWKKNPNEWLSSVDIEKVMKQYEHAYPSFQFIGPSPIDFDSLKLYDQCVWEDLCKFDLYNYLHNGKTKIGIVFNTDPHYKSGSHWISLFINIKKKQIFFFDSVGDKIPAQIKKFVDNVIEQGHNMNPRIDFTFDENFGVEHQYKNTECGVYSLFFIVHMLEDKITGHYLKTHILKDEYMQKFRKIYFNDDL